MEGQEQGTMAGNGNDANILGPRDGEKLSSADIIRAL